MGQSNIWIFYGTLFALSSAVLGQNMMGVQPDLSRPSQCMVICANAAFGVAKSIGVADPCPMPNFAQSFAACMAGEQCPENGMVDWNSVCNTAKNDVNSGSTSSQNVVVAQPVTTSSSSPAAAPVVVAPSTPAIASTSSLTSSGSASVVDPNAASKPPVTYTASQSSSMSIFTMHSLDLALVAAVVIGTFSLL